MLVTLRDKRNKYALTTRRDMKMVDIGKLFLPFDELKRS